MAKEKKYMKYFELTVADAKDWGWKDYIIWILESLYMTIFPFIAGMLLIKRNEIVWLFMIILPIYFRLRISKKDSGEKKKRIYVKE